MAKTSKKPSKPVAKPAQESKPPKQSKTVTRKGPADKPASVVPAYQPTVMGVPIAEQNRPINPLPPATGTTVGGGVYLPMTDARTRQREAVAAYQRATHQPHDDPGLLDYRRGEREAPRQKLGRSTASPVPPFIRPPLGGAYYDIGTRLARSNYNGQPGVIRPPVGGVYATDDAFLPAYQAQESGGYSSGGGGGDGYDYDDYFPRYGGGGGGYSPREYEDPAWLAGLMSWRF